MIRISVWYSFAITAIIGWLVYSQQLVGLGPFGTLVVAIVGIVFFVLLALGILRLVWVRPGYRKYFVSRDMPTRVYSVPGGLHPCLFTKKLHPAQLLIGSGWFEISSLPGSVEIGFDGLGILYTRETADTVFCWLREQNIGIHPVTGAIDTVAFEKCIRELWNSMVTANDSEDSDEGWQNFKSFLTSKGFTIKISRSEYIFGFG